jgi:hypothetical protein
MTAAVPQPAAVNADIKTAIFQALTDLGCNFTADAVEASEVTEGNGELAFVTPIEFKVAMSEADLRKAALQAFGKPYRIKVTVGTPVNAGAVVARSSTSGASAAEEEAMQRAIADPAIQSFREAFPGAEIRQVRNLKEGQ